MRRFALVFALFAVAVALFGPAAAPAAEPERVPTRLFDVASAPGPALDVTFTATLSEISTYPVTITAVQGSTEEKLWEGVVSEGVYKVRLPLQRISSGSVHVVVKIKMTNLDAKGNQTYYVYRRWDGSI